MLYEKTLSRKIIGTHEESTQTTDKHVDDTLQGPMKAMRYPRIFWMRMSGWISGPSRAKEEIVKQPASMGKILNLMR